MICKTCATEIADKAIVCYRCGAATATPQRRPPSAPAGGRVLAMRLSLMAAIAVIVTFAVLALPRLEEGWPRSAGFAAVAVVTFVVTRAIRRRFQR